MNGKIYEVVKASWKTDKTRQDKIKNWNRKIEAALEREGEKKKEHYTKKRRKSKIKRERLVCGIPRPVSLQTPFLLDDSEAHYLLPMSVFRDNS